MKLRLALSLWTYPLLRYSGALIFRKTSYNSENSGRCRGARDASETGETWDGRVTVTLMTVRYMDKLDLIARSRCKVANSRRRFLWGRDCPETVVAGLTGLPVQVHLGIPVARQFKSNLLESFLEKRPAKSRLPTVGQLACVQKRRSSLYPPLSFGPPPTSFFFLFFFLTSFDSFLPGIRLESSEIEDSARDLLFTVTRKDSRARYEMRAYHLRATSLYKIFLNFIPYVRIWLMTEIYYQTVEYIFHLWKYTHIRTIVFTHFF